MISLSLCMIVKNEEMFLEKCLESVKDVVDEIIIVDTGSTDRTVEIAKKYTKKLYLFQWVDDFSAARNFAFQHAKKDYILTMDADDCLGDEDKNKLLQLKASLRLSIDAVTMKYLVDFDEQGNCVASIRQVRIVKRDKHFKWCGAVHEYLDVSGNILHSAISVTHNRVRQNHNRNLLIYEGLLKKGVPFTPRDLYYYANELYDHRQFTKAILIYLDFLNTENRWLEDERTAYYRIAECYVHLNQMEQAIVFALKPFQSGPPRPEDCCRLGFFFLQDGRPEIALHWFKMATALPEVDFGGTVYHGCSTWIPHLQLCICYFKLGDIKKAYEHILTAHSYYPNHKLIKNNKTILESIV